MGRSSQSQTGVSSTAAHDAGVVRRRSCPSLLSARHVVAIGLLAAGVIGTPPLEAFAQDPRRALEVALQGRYTGRIATLRGFPPLSHVRYDASGEPIDAWWPGIWTLDGRVRIDRVRVSRTMLRLDGSRLAVSYNQETQAFSHALMRDRRIRIDIALGPAADETEIEAALQRVFLTDRDNLAELVPPHWRAFLEYYEQMQARPDRGEAPPIGKAPNKFASVPTLLREVKPTFPKTAQQFAQEGTVLLEAFVTREGAVERIQVTHPRGFGFEEAAIEALRQWQFAPALVNGEAVGVVVTVQMSFTLRR